MTLTETVDDVRTGEDYNKNTWYLGYVASNISNGLTTPLIPLFVTFFLGLSVFYVGMTTAIVSAASVPALIFWGVLSDKYKKRKIFIMIGFLGAFASLLPIIFVRNLESYILVLVLFQLVAMASVPVSTLILVENSEKEKWSGVMGKFNTLASIGTVSGLGLGIALVTVYRNAGTSLLLYMYVLSAFFYLIAASVIHFSIPEPERKIPRRLLGRLHSLRIIERNRFFPSNVLHFLGLGSTKHPLTGTLKAYLFGTFFLMFAFNIFMVPYPVFMIDHLGSTQIEIYILYMFNATFGTLTYPMAGRMSRRFGLRGMLAVALISRMCVFGLVGLLSMVAFASSLWLAVFIMIYGLIGSLWSFIGIAETASISTISVPKLRGKAIGYYNSLNGVGQILGGLVSGILASYIGYSIDFVTAAVMVALGAAAILRLTPSKQISKRAMGGLPQL